MCLPYLTFPVSLSFWAIFCVISSVLACRNKNLKRRTDQCYSPVLQLNFIQKVKENASLRCEDRPTQKTQREDRGPDPKQGREAHGSILAPLFICFFLLTLSLPYINWASHEGYLFYLRFSLWSSDLPLFYFPRPSSSLSSSHRHSGLLFPILTT